MYIFTRDKIKGGVFVFVLSVNFLIFIDYRDYQQGFLLAGFFGQDFCLGTYFPFVNQTSMSSALNAVIFYQQCLLL